MQLIIIGARHIIYIYTNIACTYWGMMIDDEIHFVSSFFFYFLDAKVLQYCLHPYYIQKSMNQYTSQQNIVKPETYYRDYKGNEKPMGFIRLTHAFDNILSLNSQILASQKTQPFYPTTLHS